MLKADCKFQLLPETGDFLSVRREADKPVYGDQNKLWLTFYAIDLGDNVPLLLINIAEDPAVFFDGIK